MRNAALERLEEDTELYAYLVQRLGKTHLRQRLGVETRHEADRFGQGRTFFNIENWRLGPKLIRLALMFTGLTARARGNVTDFRVRHNRVVLGHLPEKLDGFTLLHLSDLHLDSLEEFPRRLAERIGDLEYDICVMTGDYRFLTHGPHETAMEGLEQLCKHIEGDIYGVLGNHDSIVMARPMEDLGIRLLMNESVEVGRGGASFHLAGIDDPHYFAADNLEKAYQDIPDEGVSLLLSHSPEVYRLASYVGFDFMMCGHTHAGQICLPGSIALTYNSSAPRFTGRGRWSFDMMQGYTSAGTGSSIVPARFNCPPEITLHRLSAL